MSFKSTAVLLTACAALMGCQQEAATDPTAAATSGETAAAQGEAAPGVSLVDAVGVQVAWLESRVGPARIVNAPYRHYTIGGCEVRVRASGAEVEGFAIPLTPACEALALPVLADYDLPAKLGLTFGEFAQARGNARFKADCLTLCGNAADPWIYLESEGPRASPGIRAATVLVDNAAIDASFRIRDRIRAARGEDYLVDAGFNCDTTFNAVAIEEMRNIAVGEVEVGYPAYDQAC